MLNKDHVLCSEALYLTFNTFHIHNLSPTVTQYMPYSQPKFYLPIALGIFVGCQLPDIDSASSKIAQFTRPVSNLIAHFGHRGFMHSLWALMLMYLIFWWLIPSYFGLTNTIFIAILHGLCYGYTLHILEDAPSKAGIIWFFPFPKKSYHKWKHNIYVRNNVNTGLRYKTNGYVEHFIRKVSIVIIYLDIFLMIYQNL